MPRESFLKPVKHKLAQRAAYRCSFPGCDRLTIGPGLNDDEIENTGKAAHIYAASKSGPRGQGTLTSADLRSITNGIWMCGHHADLIDKNSGKRYPVTVIKSWKALHEFRIAYEHSGRSGAFGFVRSITIHDSPLFENCVVDLGKTTFLVGPNRSGKTALLDWLSVIDTPKRLRRWLKPSHLQYVVLFDTLSEHLLVVDTGNGKIKCTLDNNSVPFNHHRVAIAIISKRRDQKANDDLANIASLLRLDDISVHSLAELVGHPKMFLAGARFELREDDEGEKREELICTLNNGSEFSYTQLSGGEQGRVLLEFAIAYIESVALFAPALLIVERPDLGIDVAGFAIYLDYFSSKECRFQTVITQYTVTDDIRALGCQVYQLRGKTKTAPGKIAPLSPV